MKEPLEMLVRILCNGGRVDDDGNEYAMLESGRVCIIMRQEDGTEVPVGIDCDVAALKRLADRIGRNELWLRCCALQLRTITRT